MGKWDLSVLYSGLDDPKFDEDMKAVEGYIGEYVRLAEAAASYSHGELLRRYVKLSVDLNSAVSKVAIFCNLRYSANTQDMESASALGKIMAMTSSLAAPSAALNKVIAGLSDLEELVTEPDLSEFSYFLLNIKRDSKYLLGDGEEAVFAKLNISGASAWSDLHSALTSTVKASYRGEEITLPAVRNLAYDKDPEVRRDAYYAELACYPTIEESVAFALNSIKLQVLSECEMRGYESPLAKSLYDSRMKRETLDALMQAIEEYLPAFRKYLRAKAKALGHEGGLPWYDLFAPMGRLDRTFDVEGAKDYLLDIFGKFDGELHDLVKCAFENRWIDFYPRENKVGGAFDCGIPSAKESRVLTNFDGSFSSVTTLAHELGHSFHDRQVSRNSIINQDYSMPVAETASTFNEVLVMETAMAGARDADEKLALLENELMESCQIICDIYSRFKFEASVFEHRPEEFMNAKRLSELMLDAQRLAYGDGLDAELMHPYMWLCKGHYYSGGLSFYNYPYAFGGLFARGLYAKYKSEGEGFVGVYKRMLNATGVMDVEDCARVAGVDLTDVNFWRAGLAGIADKIDEFVRIVNN